MYVRGSGMRLRAELLGSLIACVAFAAEPPLHFAVIGQEAGAWPQILSSVGFVRQDSDLAKVFVLRTATPASQSWAERVERGAYLILEGESPVAESFGFRGGKQRLRVGSIVDGLSTGRAAAAISAGADTSPAD